MQAKLVDMSKRIRQLEDALRKLERNASGKTRYQSCSSLDTLLDIEWRNDVKTQAPLEEDTLAEPLDEPTSEALCGLGEAGFIGLQPVEVRTSVFFELMFSGIHPLR